MSDSILFRVVWSEFADSKFGEVFKYYNDEYSVEKAINFLTEVTQNTKRLQSQHFIGKIEELLEGREFQYRYSIVRNYKIIYRVDEEEKIIKIVDFFDCRQNPSKLTDSFK